ncbi:MAG TPA: RNA methyltransferase [Mycobacteriales bacterium]|nr:RNA methyltransferase [Mycobacteriales bacterium]
MLASRKHRQRTGTFMVEGIQPVWQAIEAGADVEQLLVAPGLLAGSPALQLLADPVAPVAYLTNELFTRLSTRDRPAGLAAVVRARPTNLEELPVQDDSLFVALHLIGNPGNLGTIVRTAVSTGVDAVLLLDHTADPYAPSAVRASMGAIFSVPVVHLPDAETFLRWTREHAITVVTTSPNAERNHWTTGYPLPGALVLGGERVGLPEELLARGDLRVRIPMAGTTDSLNAAIAAGIMLYEMRRAHPMADRIWEFDRVGVSQPVVDR